MEFLGNVRFLGQGKTGVPGEKPRGARERTNKNPNTHIWRQRWEWNQGDIGGRQVLEPLRHPCPSKKIIKQVHHSIRNLS